MGGVVGDGENDKTHLGLNCPTVVVPFSARGMKLLLWAISVFTHRSETRPPPRGHRTTHVPRVGLDGYRYSHTTQGEHANQLGKGRAVHCVYVGRGDLQ